MRESYIEKGFNDYLAKPINKQELEDVIGNILNPTPEGRKEIFEPLPKELFEMDKPLNEMDLTKNSKVIETDDKDKKELLKEKGVDIDSSLELLGDFETYNETLKTFFNEIEEKKENLTKFIETNDLENYRILVHSLKSDSKYLGFSKLAAISFDHEMASKEGDIDFVTEHYQELVTEANKIYNIIKEYIGE
jgi:HPt (histidine-containing phosphotransfer) domain-containing protein